MAERYSPLATAFLWAAGMAAAFGIGDTVIWHENPDHVANDVITAAGVAGVVAYSERKRLL